MVILRSFWDQKGGKHVEKGWNTTAADYIQHVEGLKSSFSPRKTIKTILVELFEP